MKCALVIPAWSPAEIFSIRTAASQINYWQPLGTLYVAASLPFTVFVLTAFFRTLPGELREAALMDGASEIRIFRSVMMPLLLNPAQITGSVSVSIH